jgi:uncharacterized protein (TIGR02271 family)
MSRTVTAFYDTRSEAESAKSRLQASSIDADRIRIIDKDSGGSSSSTSGSGDSSGGGFFSSLTDMFMPNEDRYAYQEGISRGGYLLCAQVDEHEADEAIRILDETGSVDFDQREEQWRGEGWAGWTGGSMNNQHVSGSGTPMTAGMQTGMHQQQAATGSADRTAGEEHIPIVEEELKIGKREVNRGGARVRSYVREIPVHEQVSLREEHVDVERRPVNERIDPREAGNLFQDREIEMTETAEEAVVAKEARVKEEVVVRKTAEEHVEQIDDTVRRTEVDVDRGGTGGSGGSAFGFNADRDGNGTPDSMERDRQRSDDPAWRG